MSKERYECKYNEKLMKHYTFDNENKEELGYKCVVRVLNQQNKRIKELEETNKVLSNELTKNSILKKGYIETCCGIPIFEIPKIKEENQQLKQQLAEKEKIEYTDTINFVETSEPDIVAKELDRLNEQLAEKDKDIKYFKESYYMIQDEKDHYAGQCLNLQDRIEELEKIISESFHNQDKISFAVEQLELAQKYIQQYVNNFDDMYDCLYAIDNQIKQLKEGK